MISRRMFVAGAAACCCAGVRPVHGQSMLAGGDVICSYQGALDYEPLIRISDPDPEALQVIRLILDTVGVMPNFDVYEGEFSSSPIAVAMVRGRRRIIVYDGNVFRWSNGRVSWTEFVVMCHEIAHHIGLHLGPNTLTRHEEELEADRFSGTVVARLGGTLEEALSLTALLSAEGSDTHPPRAQRAAAIEDGWNHGRSMVRRESGLCRNDWLGDAMDIGGRRCRAAHVCDGNGDAVRLACEGDGGRWIWMD